MKIDGLLTSSALVLLSGFLAVEAVLRWSGVANFPVFRVDSRKGYYPAPNQHGAFLRKHRWAFNDRSLGVATPYRWTPDGVLLVGDSIVYGNNQMDQADRLGPVLAKATRRPVWPLAAGGWSLNNELRMLQSNPDFLRLSTIVWVSNTGDFGMANEWTNPAQYPNHKPRSIFFYLLHRTILKARDVVDASTSPGSTRQWQENLQWLLDNYHGQLLWVLYPKKTELGADPLDFEPLVKIIEGRAEVLNLATNDRWRNAAYLDNIHPSANANHLMAREICDALVN